jgi:hypothetical protein
MGKINRKFSFDTTLTTLQKKKKKKLGGIYGGKRDEETGGWRKLHNEELHNLYSSPSIITYLLAELSPS